MGYPNPQWDLVKEEKVCMWGWGPYVAGQTSAEVGHGLVLRGRIVGAPPPPPPPLPVFGATVLLTSEPVFQQCALPVQ